MSARFSLKVTTKVSFGCKNVKIVAFLMLFSKAEAEEYNKVIDVFLIFLGRSYLP